MKTITYTIQVNFMLTQLLTVIILLSSSIFFHSINLFILFLQGKDMDVNQHEILSSFTPRQRCRAFITTLVSSNSSFSQSRVYSNEHNPYSKMSVKWPLASSWAVIFFSVLVHHKTNFISIRSFLFNIKRINFF